MTECEKTLVSIAVAAAKNWIHVFEAEYPADDRPRRALEATENWLKKATQENRLLVIEAEDRVEIQGLETWPRKGCDGDMRICWQDRPQWVSLPELILSMCTHDHADLLV